MAETYGGMQSEVVICNMAIKTFNEFEEDDDGNPYDAKEMFERELSILQLFADNPQVVKMYGYNREKRCIILEACFPITLEKILERCSPTYTHECTSECFDGSNVLCQENCRHRLKVFRRTWLEQCSQFCLSSVEKHVTHVDLKAKNIVFRLNKNNKPDFSSLVFIDFGLSVVEDVSKHSNSQVWQTVDLGAIKRNQFFYIKDKILAIQLLSGLGFQEALNFIERV